MSGCVQQYSKDLRRYSSLLVEHETLLRTRQNKNKLESGKRGIQKAGPTCADVWNTAWDTSPRIASAAPPSVTGIVK